MSLKDRLGNQTKTTLKIKKKEPQTLYYPTSEISEGVDSLGEIDTLFADDDINLISVYGAKNIFIEKKGKRTKLSLAYSDNTRLENIIRKNAELNGAEYSEKHPFIEFGYKKGINVCATLPPLSDSATMIVKYYKDKFATIKSLVEKQAMSKEMAIIVDALAALKVNIIIAGETNTLKTTLLSALAKKVPQNNNGVIFDYSNELKVEKSNIITYDFKNYQNETLIKNVIESNPNRIFLNDCPNLEYFEKFIENGYRGICATLNVNNPYDVLQKIYLRNTDVIIFTKKNEQKRYISSLSLAKGSELEDIFYLNEQNEYKSTGIVPEFFNSMEKSQLPISGAVFEADYKHTFHTSAQNEASENFAKKSINTEILKKFKKDINKKENTIQENKNSIEQENNE